MDPCAPPEARGREEGQADLLPCREQIVPAAVCDQSQMNWLFSPLYFPNFPQHSIFIIFKSELCSSNLKVFSAITEILYDRKIIKYGKGKQK